MPSVAAGLLHAVPGTVIVPFVAGLLDEVVREPVVRLWLVHLGLWLEVP